MRRRYTSLAAFAKSAFRVRNSRAKGNGCDHAGDSMNACIAGKCLQALLSKTGGLEREELGYYWDFCRSFSVLKSRLGGIGKDAVQDQLVFWGHLWRSIEGPIDPLPEVSIGEQIQA